MFKQTTSRWLGKFGRDATQSRGGAAAPPELVRELAEVADYIARLKTGIAALRASELTKSRIPMAHGELGVVVDATASATNRIMEVAESILTLGPMPHDAYRAAVENRMNDIFEACTFQDITGQRISKVVDALGQLEKRLAYFVSIVPVRDGEASEEEIQAEARREALIINGPQRNGPATPQDAIDALFA